MSSGHSTAGGKPRRVGSSVLCVSPVGMGCALLGAFWQGRSRTEGRRAVAEARESGITLFDTADVYARGISERTLGRAIAQDRDNVVLCTKVGLLKTLTGFVSAATATRRGSVISLSPRGLLPSAAASGCFEPRYLLAAVERSLRRLRTDVVDLLLLHSPSVDVLNSGTFMPGLVDLLKAGKIRHFGISCASVAEARVALAVPGIVCLEVPFGLLSPLSTESVIVAARERNVGVLANRSLGDGRLLQLAGERLPHVSRQDVIATALQFSAASAGVSSVLVGMSRIAHVRATVEAASAEVADDVRAAILALAAEARSACGMTC